MKLKNAMICLYLSVGAVVFLNPSYANATARASQSAHMEVKYFNIRGQLTGVVSPDSNGDGRDFLATRNTYDINGNLSLVETGYIQYWYGDTQPENWVSYNFRVNNSVSYTYNADGLKDSISTMDSSGTIITFKQISYDNRNRVKCEATRMNPGHFGDTSTDACSLQDSGAEYGQDRITHYTYDELTGNVLKVYKAYGTPLQQVYKENRYYATARGYLESVTDANSNTTSYEYDAYGNVEYVRFPDGTFEHYVYDLQGNIDEETKRNGTKFIYHQNFLNERTFKQEDGTNRFITYSYDNNGVMLTADWNEQVSPYYSLPTGENVTNTYNAFGDMTSTSVTMNTSEGTKSHRASFFYDDHGNRTTIMDSNYKSIVYTYDGNNRLDTITADGLSIIDVEYDLYGRRSKLNRANNTSTSYGYDGISRLGSIEHTFSASSSSNNIRYSYGYNPASQLITTETNNSNYHERQYQFNKSYGVNNLNQYTTINGHTLSYDDNGNLTGNPLDALSYGYDSENRLINTSGTMRTGQFVYDPLGRLFFYKINGTSYELLYEGDALIAEYSNGNMTKRYVHGDGVDEPLVQFSGSSMNAYSVGYLYANHQGSIVALSAYGGVSLNTYDEFGVATGNTGRFGYTGQAWIEELGLNYYKARIYHPKLGRFLQTDPVGYEDQMNLYAYVANDPINNNDPTGKWIMQAIGGIIGGIQAAQAVSGSSAHWTDKAIAIAGGVTIGALTGGRGTAAVNALASKVTSKALQKAVSVTASGTVGGVSGGSSQIISDVVTGQDVTVEKTVQATANGVISGTVGGAPAKQGLSIATTIVTEGVLQTGQALADPAVTQPENPCKDPDGSCN